MEAQWSRLRSHQGLNPAVPGKGRLALREDSRLRRMEEPTFLAGLGLGNTDLPCISWSSRNLGLSNLGDPKDGS